jgi:hypothetical protein
MILLIVSCLLIGTLRCSLETSDVTFLDSMFYVYKEYCNAYSWSDFGLLTEGDGTE